MSLEKVYDVPLEVAAGAHITEALYREMYERSIKDSDKFWSEQAERFVDWFKPWDKVQDCDFGTARIRWFEGGKLNVSYNCLDRHLAEKGDQVAIIWEGDDPDLDRTLTFRELHEQVCRFANVLKKHGVEKSDRVCIYLPMIPEAAVAMLACARIGAVHSIVFAGFSADALRDRILDADCRYVICADEGNRGGRTVPLKTNVDTALQSCPNVKTVIVVRNTGGTIDWDARSVWYHEELAEASPDCPPESMDAEDPLFILYTSGSTGKPKGVLHSTGGYLVYAAMTFQYVFDYRPGEIYWCTADVGWITGHSYTVYGPLCNGATTLMFEGIPTYPAPDRFWRVVEKHRVNIFYTAPTAIRALMAQGDNWLETTDRGSLRVLGSVGEPINPEAWEWYYHHVGRERCPIVDTWWQTETGGILITPLIGATRLKPGSATRPFFGIVPAIVDSQGNVLEGDCEGVLTITRSWPGQARSVFGSHQRFFETYFSAYPGKYFTGDGARRDADGYYWITGRVDDVLNVSGHRMGTAEIESALVLHDSVAEAAVVGYPHNIKGQGIYAYVTLVAGISPSAELEQELIQLVRKEIGPIATPDLIQWAPTLPKTRSGKIMRRILRKIAANEIRDLGDISTLADPGVVEEIIQNRANRS
ncbi:acetyl-coenzyme A synthetase [Methylocaldum marinum]|uniref:Acetyl-coenzyme A synthetase n=1 Tax=Methylocaldum marinum TaxID=1432792 RepID=A0A250KM01_9GAMM|nr:acetate--CoA ligase [Methylocaldum marinum]BBA32588.1 acetyl-coenzyme A synthetase [Methylocaldum marinum]